MASRMKGITLSTSPWASARRACTRSATPASTACRKRSCSAWRLCRSKASITESSSRRFSAMLRSACARAMRSARSTSLSTMWWRRAVISASEMPRCASSSPGSRMDAASRRQAFIRSAQRQPTAWFSDRAWARAASSCATRAWRLWMTPEDSTRAESACWRVSWSARASAERRLWFSMRSWPFSALTTSSFSRRDSFCSSVADGMRHLPRWPLRLVQRTSRLHLSGGCARVITGMGISEAYGWWRCCP
mmetsp:Transcript_14381/g.48737  ORF Transcript_14381/g.48737 Transcript_14381/m.48737 type:complete len:249 (-) Transcript_14381:499-1245(-)